MSVPTRSCMDLQKARLAFAYQGPPLRAQIFNELNLAVLETTVVQDKTYALLKMANNKNCRGRQLLKTIQLHNKFSLPEEQIHLCKLDGQQDEIVCELANNPILTTIRAHRLAVQLSKPPEEARAYTIWRHTDPRPALDAGPVSKRPRLDAAPGVPGETAGSSLAQELEQTKKQLEEIKKERDEYKARLKQTRSDLAVAKKTADYEKETRVKANVDNATELKRVRAINDDLKKRLEAVEKTTEVTPESETSSKPVEHVAPAYDVHPPNPHKIPTCMTASAPIRIPNVIKREIYVMGSKSYLK